MLVNFPCEKSLLTNQCILVSIWVIFPVSGLLVVSSLSFCAFNSLWMEQPLLLKTTTWLCKDSQPAGCCLLDLSATEVSISLTSISESDRFVADKSSSWDNYHHLWLDLCSKRVEINSMDFIVLVASVQIPQYSSKGIEHSVCSHHAYAYTTFALWLHHHPCCLDAGVPTYCSLVPRLHPP